MTTTASSAASSAAPSAATTEKEVENQSTGLEIILFLKQTNGYQKQIGR